MGDILRLLGFTLLSLRFFYWVGFFVPSAKRHLRKILLATSVEGLLLLFLFSQFFGKVRLFPMQETLLTQISGLTLVSLGVVGALLAKKQLGSAWTHAVAYTIKPKQQLVTSGIYSLVRHPIYSSTVCLYVGAELLAGSWLWISFLFFFIPCYLQAKREEKLLTAHFGKTYQDYQRRTKMLIPYLL